MSSHLTVLKLGGSLLTDKSHPYVVREDIIASVSKEIRECMDSGLIQFLVLVHGVGSYGHPPVLEHKLHKGFLGTEQLLPISKTQAIVGEFRALLVKHLQEAEIPVCLMYPSSMIIAEKMKIIDFYLEPLKAWLKMGTVPLLGGDMLVDTAMGWSVGSGDQMAVILSKELCAKRLIFASDVSGIYESEPKENPDAQIIHEINLNEVDSILERLSKSGTKDASGAMKGKLHSILPAKDLIENGLDVTIMSMMKYGTLTKLLENEEDIGTKIVSK
ncbi:MAG: amino acid kinase [Candidatus Lokiarchaeota archaeon]|nr:amino acid kinase [Candidatus Lokiarchaeota archaeon]